MPSERYLWVCHATNTRKFAWVNTIDGNKNIYFREKKKKKKKEKKENFTVDLKSKTYSITNWTELNPRHSWGWNKNIDILINLEKKNIDILISMVNLTYILTIPILHAMRQYFLEVNTLEVRSILSILRIHILANRYDELFYRKNLKRTPFVVKFFTLDLICCAIGWHNTRK